MEKKLLLSFLMLLPLIADAIEIEGVNYVFSNKNKTAYVGQKAYSGNVVIKESVDYNGETYKVTAIGNYAFQGCTGLTSVIIPNSVTSLGSNAFSGCSNLKSVTMSNCLTSIGYACFASCTSLPKIDIPNSVTVIVESAFKGCSSLSSIDIPSSVTAIGPAAFSGCSGLPSITIPDNVKTIGREAFSGCSALTSVTIGNGVTEIAVRAFQNCSSLTSLFIGSNVTTITSYAFYNCKSLTTLTIPSGVTTIKGYAFQSCNNLSTVVLPNTLTTIDSYAFQYCNKLTTVIVDIVEPISIKVYTFPTNNATLYVPKGCASAYANANIWKKFKVIKEFVKKEDVVYTMSENKTVSAKATTDPAKKNVVIPKSVKIDDEDYIVNSIDEQAFMYKRTMTMTSIPESVEEIRNNAFAGCSNLKAIYCYAKEPIALGSANITVSTRADGDVDPAETVFTGVDMETCILFVPKNCSSKYRNAIVWKEFKNIVEIESDLQADANNDGTIDNRDINAVVRYILYGDLKDFIFKNADMNGDDKVDVRDIVLLLKK